METFTALVTIDGVLIWSSWLGGAVLNIMLLVMFIRHREIRTPENVLLINLCVADLTYLLSFLKMLFTSLIYNDKTACLAVLFVRSFILALSAYSVVAISIQRYRGIIKFENRLLEDETNYKKPIRIVIGVWMFAILLAAVELIVMALNYNQMHCIFDIGVSGYRMCLYGFLPAAIIMFCYTAASCKIRRSADNIPGVEYEALAELRDRRKRSASIISTLSMSFYLTYVPYLICMFMLTHLSSIIWLNKLHLLLASLTSALNPLYNPIALCAASSQFRELYKKYCCCCCRKQPDDSGNSLVAYEQHTNDPDEESEA